MHILIVPSEHLTTKKNPMAGIFQYEQGRALARAGLKVGILSVDFLAGIYWFKSYPYKKYESFTNINIYRKYKKKIFPFRFFSKEKEEKIYLKLFEKTYLKYIKKHGVPDIIHAHNFLEAGLFALHIKKKYNIPFVLTEHSTAFARGLVRKELENEIKEICQQASALTCVSSPFKKLLENRYEFKFSVLFNIVDKLFFKHPISVKEENTFTFINVAFMDEKKNQALLITTFAKLYKNTNKKLVLIGNGILENTLKELTVELDINKQVSFLGRLSRERVCAEMLKADCFVLTSNYETFGVVLIEALASGLPLIATKCGGPEDIVNSGNGILIDVNNQIQLENAMIKIINNYKQYDKEKLRAEAQHRFGEKAFVDNALSFYEKGIKK